MSDAQRSLFETRTRSPEGSECSSSSGYWIPAFQSSSSCPLHCCSSLDILTERLAKFSLSMLHFWASCAGMRDFLTATLRFASARSPDDTVSKSFLSETAARCWLLPPTKSASILPTFQNSQSKSSLHEFSSLSFWLAVASLQQSSLSLPSGKQHKLIDSDATPLPASQNHCNVPCHLVHSGQPGLGVWTTPSPCNWPIHLWHKTSLARCLALQEPPQPSCAKLETSD